MNVGSSRDSQFAAECADARYGTDLREAEAAILMQNPKFYHDNIFTTGEERGFVRLPADVSKISTRTHCSRNA
jgi:hypothetical protein